jgi:hypothetical protein
MNKLPATNRRLAKKRVQCLYEALCFVSSSVVADSLVLRNPLLRQAPKRYASLLRPTSRRKIKPKNKFCRLQLNYLSLTLVTYYDSIFWRQDDAKNLGW